MTYIAIAGTCAKEHKNIKPGQSTRDLQNIVRRIIRDDTVSYLKELPNENSIFKKLSFMLLTP
ncbi:MAG: hypothetical protein WHV26_08365 [Spirochaetota bacterium]